MLTDSKEVVWCVDCGVHFTQEEIKGRGCPKCGSQGVRCDCDKDTAVEINWHELRILVTWAEYWAQQCHRQQCDDSSEGMLKTIHAIARRLQGQHPGFGHLTLSGPGRSAGGGLGAGYRPDHPSNNRNSIRKIGELHADKIGEHHSR